MITARRNPLTSDSAACASVDPALWFPETGGPNRQAFQICHSCPIEADCLEWAIEHNELGIWAGTTEKERRILRRHRETGMNENAARLMAALGRFCSVPGCTGDLYARGWCNRHYLRWYKHGDPEGAVA